MKFRPQLIAILLLSIMLLINGSAHAENVKYTFGIVPQQSAAKLARLWGPILRQVGEKSGLQVQFKTAPDIPTFEQRLAKGEYDFAYMNPYHYTVFHDSNGYKALAKARDKRIKGILVVRKDSAVQNLSDLNNSQLAFPAPAAFAASILTRGNLQASNVNFEPKYVSSHDSVYRTVAKGLYPAGGGVMRTLNNVAPEIREQLRVLWTSDGYTPHAIAAHSRVNQRDFSAVQQALIALDETEHGKQLLGSIKIKGFEAANNEDWNDVRDLNLKELSNL